MCAPHGALSREIAKTVRVTDLTVWLADNGITPVDGIAQLLAHSCCCVMVWVLHSRIPPQRERVLQLVKTADAR